MPSVHTQGTNADKDRPLDLALATNTSKEPI